SSSGGRRSELMIISWQWLREYLDVEMNLDEFVQRLTMAGLNFESCTELSDDWAIDLEVTSNRPDCLGHIGIAREAAVLFDGSVRIPDPQLTCVADRVEKETSVTIESSDLCPQYIARVI